MATITIPLMNNAATFNLVAKAKKIDPTKLAAYILLKTFSPSAVNFCGPISNGLNPAIKIEN